MSLCVLAGGKIIVLAATAFTLSWTHGADEPVGRSTIWLQPAIPLRFVFESEQPESLDQNLLKRMANDANSSRGLSLDIDAAEAPAAERPSQARPNRTASSTAPRSLVRAA